MDDFLRRLILHYLETRDAQRADPANFGGLPSLDLPIEDYIAERFQVAEPADLWALLDGADFNDGFARARARMHGKPLDALHAAYKSDPYWQLEPPSIEELREALAHAENEAADRAFDRLLDEHPQLGEVCRRQFDRIWGGRPDRKRPQHLSRYIDVWVFVFENALRQLEDEPDRLDDLVDQAATLLVDCTWITQDRKRSRIDGLDRSIDRRP